MRQRKATLCRGVFLLKLNSSRSRRCGSLCGSFSRKRAAAQGSFPLSYALTLSYHCVEGCRGR
jgi:hypothetical protein